MSIEPGGVPQKKIGQYWRYKFLTNDNLYLFFYGFSEEEARAQYEGPFVAESLELISREPW